VHLTDNSPITVSVDGRYFNKRGTSVTVGDLPPGTHTLRIYGGRSAYGRGGSELVYKGRIPTAMGQKTDFMYDPYSGNGTARNEEIGSYNNGQANGSNYHSNEPDRSGDDVYGRSNSNNNNTDNNSYAPQNNAGDIPPTTTTPPANNNSDMPVASPVIVDEGSMTTGRTSKLKSKVTSKKTDTEKLKVLKEELKNERVTTYQVSVMMDWLSFESSRLDFAKWAYDITGDKEAYSGLGAKFSYKESEKELNDFLQTKH
jgi:hypothetical protein